MEIKVICTCGTKFKFDVEPVNERMPWPVNCPACGIDATGLANDVLRQTFAANIVVASAIPKPQAVPAAPPPPPPPPPAPSAPPPGIKLNRPATQPPAPPPPPVPSFEVVHSEAPKPSKKSVWITVAVVFVICVVIGSAGYKIYKRVKSVVDVAMAIKEAGDSAVREWNLTADDQVILFVKHTNHTEVAEACVAYWKEKLRRNVRMIKPEQEEGEGGEIVIMPSHNGYVRLMGGLDWKEAQFEGAAQHLSQRFNTMVFAEKDIDFSGEFVFGVYDQGTNLFHARMDIKMNNGGNEPDEVVTTKGNEWAVKHGFKPGPEGFKEFSIGDANELTKKFGMKFWDEADVATNYVILKDPVMAQAQ